MRYLRMLVIMAVLLVAVSSSGCKFWTWAYDFTAPEASLEDWYCNYGGDYELDDAGLAMRHVTISTPVYFIGDLTATVTFDLDVDEERNARLEVGLSEGIFWEAVDGMYIDMWCIGNPDSEGWLIEEWDSDNYVYYEEQGPIGPVIYEGENVLKLTKCGDSYTFFLNGAKMFTMVAKFADLSENFLNIWTGQAELGNLIVKNVEVKYEEISEPWPILN